MSLRSKPPPARMRSAERTRRSGGADMPSAQGRAALRFSTDEVRASERMARWRELFGRHIVDAQFEALPDADFSQTAVLHSWPGLSLVVATAAGFRLHRTAPLLADRNDNLVLAVNIEGAARAFQLGREAAIAPGEGVLLSCADVFCIHYATRTRYIMIATPHRSMTALVNDPEAALARTLSQEIEALRLLTSYLTSIDDSVTFADSDLRYAFTTHVQELVALATSATCEGAELARGRGVRAARLADIVAEIKASFADPAFSPRTIATKFGLTPRYIQELLSDSGSSFTDRVLELRLQKARAMLADSRHDRLRVTEIAYACGFNDISYFNRSFRRRFGASPLQYRGSDSGTD